MKLWLVIVAAAAFLLSGCSVQAPPPEIVTTPAAANSACQPDLLDLGQKDARTLKKCAVQAKEQLSQKLQESAKISGNAVGTALIQKPVTPDMMNDSPCQVDLTQLELPAIAVCSAAADQAVLHNP